MRPVVRFVCRFLTGRQIALAPDEAEYSVIFHLIICRVIAGLSVFAQRLLVLLFGTFRVIAMHAENGGMSGMSADALGVSIAPSFFMSCMSNGKQAKLEDIQRYKMAAKIVTFITDNFAMSNLFGRANYEYYARITGRVLRVDEDWIFAFDYPHEKLKLASSKFARTYHNFHTFKYRAGWTSRKAEVFRFHHVDTMDCTDDRSMVPWCELVDVTVWYRRCHVAYTENPQTAPVLNLDGCLSIHRKA